MSSVSTVLYTFEWTTNANQVIVTGSFDNWAKTATLQKSGNKFEIKLNIPRNEKVLFKFVVDGNWVTSDKFNTEVDSSGIVNNVLYPADLSKVAAASAKDVESFSTTSFEDPVVLGRTRSDHHNFLPSQKSQTESSAFTNIEHEDHLDHYQGNGKHTSDSEVDRLGSKDMILNSLHLDDLESSASFKSISSDEMFSSTHGTLSNFNMQDSTPDNSTTGKTAVSTGTSASTQKSLEKSSSSSLVSRFKKRVFG